MIKRVRIRNLGSLHNVDVTLGKFTILLGPNASGKTMFIRALRVLAKLLRSPIRDIPTSSRTLKWFELDHAPLDELVAQRDTTKHIGFDVWLDDSSGPPNYTLEIGKVDRLWGVVSESIAVRGIKWSSSDHDFEFGTERRGTIRWPTPAYPPRRACRPYLAHNFQNDTVAIP